MCSESGTINNQQRRNIAKNTHSYTLVQALFCFLLDFCCQSCNVSCVRLLSLDDVMCLIAYRAEMIHAHACPSLVFRLLVGDSLHPKVKLDCSGIRRFELNVIGTAVCAVHPHIDRFSRHNKVLAFFDRQPRRNVVGVGTFVASNEPCVVSSVPLRLHMVHHLLIFEHHHHRRLGLCVPFRSLVTVVERETCFYVCACMKCYVMLCCVCCFTHSFLILKGSKECRLDQSGQKSGCEKFRSLVTVVERDMFSCMCMSVQF